MLGTYNPLVDTNGNKIIRLNIERIKYWLGVGAQTSDTVARLFSKFDLLPIPAKRSILKFDQSILQQLQPSPSHSATNNHSLYNMNKHNENLTTLIEPTNDKSNQAIQQHKQSIYRLQHELHKFSVTPESYQLNQLPWISKLTADKQQSIDSMKQQTLAEQQKIIDQEISMKALSDDILNSALGSTTDNNPEATTQSIDSDNTTQIEPTDNKT